MQPDIAIGIDESGIGSAEGFLIPVRGREIRRKCRAGDIRIAGAIYSDRKPGIVLVAPQIGGIYQGSGGGELSHKGIPTLAEKIPSGASIVILESIEVREIGRGSESGHVNIPATVEGERGGNVVRGTTEIGDKTQTAGSRELGDEGVSEVVRSRSSLEIWLVA